MCRKIGRVGSVSAQLFLILDKSDHVFPELSLSVFMSFCTLIKLFSLS